MDKEPKIIKLPRNGPKNGQSMDAWLHGKAKGDQDWEKIKKRKSWQSLRSIQD
jgi:hypothetical protein